MITYKKRLNTLVNDMLSKQNISESDAKELLSYNEEQAKEFYHRPIEQENKEPVRKYRDGEFVGYKFYK